MDKCGYDGCSYCDNPLSKAEAQRDALLQVLLPLVEYAQLAVDLGDAAPGSTTDRLVRNARAVIQAVLA
jgi:hypothetical protein